MCWNTKLEEYAIKRIATTNITVFKVCYVREGNVISLYRGFHYKLGQLYNQSNLSVFETTFDGKYSVVSQGFHSYNPALVTALRKPGDYDVKILNTSNRIYLNNFYSTKLTVARVNGYIPAGSEYFENEFGEIVSNNLVLTDYELL